MPQERAILEHVHFAWRQDCGGSTGRKTYPFFARDLDSFRKAANRVSLYAAFNARIAVKLCLRCSVNGSTWWRQIGPDAWPHDAASREELIAERGDLLWMEAQQVRAANCFPPVGEEPGGAA